MARKELTANLADPNLNNLCLYQCHSLRGSQRDTVQGEAAYWGLSPQKDAMNWATASESEIAAECDKRLRAAGWMVVATSVDRETRRQLAGLPDRICFRHGMTLLVEYKAWGQELRPSQQKWWMDFRRHEGEHLVYELVSHPAQIERWCE